VASETTVLGDFADRRFAYGAITSTFFRREGRYMVRTGGPDGKLADFEIKYTFGVRPLQQYLIELPGGRLQALSIAWAARPRAARRSVGDRSWLEQCQAECATNHRARAGRVRSVSRAQEPDFLRLCRRSAVPRTLPAGLAHSAALLVRRTAAGRSLQLGIVPRESDARRRRHLQRLPRAPRPEAARARQPGLRPVPRAGE